MPIDHTSIQVPLAKHAEVVAFYLAALEPLGYQRLMTVGPGGSVVGLGAGRKPDWWITGVEEEVKHRTHIAFTAPDRKTVDAFYGAAIQAGAPDNGAPGLRPQYHPSYYGAFVLDPVGNNVEVVCHVPE